MDSLVINWDAAAEVAARQERIRREHPEWWMN